MLKVLFKKGKPDRFTLDIFVNIFSYFVIGVIGVLINIIIVRRYNTEVLGFFNQMTALYLLFSQISVAGIHLSVQRFVPEYSENQKINNIILTAAILACILISTIIISLGYFSRDILAIIWHDKNITTGFILILPALLLFSLNKVLLAYLTSHRMMKAFAFFQAERVVLWLISLLILIYKNTEYHHFPLIFVISEGF